MNVQLMRWLWTVDPNWKAIGSKVAVDQEKITGLLRTIEGLGGSYPGQDATNEETHAMAMRNIERAKSQ